MTTARGQTPLAAGVVAYRPEPAALARLIADLVGQVDLLLLYQNSAIPAPLLDLARGPMSRIGVIGDGRNLGLGVAYNRIVDAAVRRGIDRILLFDQDSRPPPDLGAALLHRMQGLADWGVRPAVVGPQPIAGNGRGYKVAPLVRPAEAEPIGPNLPLQFVISSGSLIDGTAFRHIGPFREDFFIDAIDVEWCLRARSRGYSCWMASDVPMRHSLGAGVVRLPLARAHIVRHPPVRVYTIIRNQLALVRLRHVPFRWKLRAAAGLLVHTIGHAMYAPHPRSTLRALAWGWRDGLLGRLGPPRMEAAGGGPDAG